MLKVKRGFFVGSPTTPLRHAHRHRTSHLPHLLSARRATTAVPLRSNRASLSVCLSSSPLAIDVHRQRGHRCVVDEVSCLPYSHTASFVTIGRHVESISNPSCLGRRRKRRKCSRCREFRKTKKSSSYSLTSTVSCM